MLSLSNVPFSIGSTVHPYNEDQNKKWHKISSSILVQNWLEKSQYQNTCPIYCQMYYPKIYTFILFLTQTSCLWSTHTDNHLCIKGYHPIKFSALKFKNDFSDLNLKNYPSDRQTWYIQGAFKLRNAVDQDTCIFKFCNQNRLKLSKSHMYCRTLDSNTKSGHRSNVSCLSGNS